MSLFPSSSFLTNNSSSSFTPLFRLLDDFDQYSNAGNNNQQGGRGIVKSFNPKFDVKENGDVYELHGELPGIEQKDVEIEFTDAQTITVKGHTERSYAAGTPPAGHIEGSRPAAAIKNSSSLQPMVEDEDTAETTTVSKVDKKEAEKPQEPEAKYWVSERSVGQFQRSFTFPVRVDQDQVKASMKNGLLSVIVPKAKKIEARRIPIA